LSNEIVSESVRIRWHLDCRTRNVLRHPGLCPAIFAPRIQGDSRQLAGIALHTVKGLGHDASSMTHVAFGDWSCMLDCFGGRVMHSATDAAGAGPTSFNA